MVTPDSYFPESHTVKFMMALLSAPLLLCWLKTTPATGLVQTCTAHLIQNTPRLIGPVPLSSWLNENKEITSLDKDLSVSMEVPWLLHQERKSRSLRKIIKRPYSEWSLLSGALLFVLLPLDDGSIRPMVATFMLMFWKFDQSCVPVHLWVRIELESAWEFSVSLLKQIVDLSTAIHTGHEKIGQNWKISLITNFSACRCYHMKLA